jgi:hypothetical protein
MDIGKVLVKWLYDREVMGNWTPSELIDAALMGLVWLAMALILKPLGTFNALFLPGAAIYLCYSSGVKRTRRLEVKRAAAFIENEVHETMRPMLEAFGRHITARQEVEDGKQVRTVDANRREGDKPITDQGGDAGHEREGDTAYVQSSKKGVR